MHPRTLSLIALLAPLTYTILCSCSLEPARKYNLDKTEALDLDACKHEAKYHCANLCITESKTPTDRPPCEVKCLKRPLSDWDGTIPECTANL